MFAAFVLLPTRFWPRNRPGAPVFGHRPKSMNLACAYARMLRPVCFPGAWSSSLSWHLQVACSHLKCLAPCTYHISCHSNPILRALERVEPPATRSALHIMHITSGAYKMHQSGTHFHTQSHMIAVRNVSIPDENRWLCVCIHAQWTSPLRVSPTILGVQRNNTPCTP